VMRGALDNAGVDASEIGWVNAHGTGTQLNDVVESKAVKEVFGPRSAEVPVVSTKSLHGHCLGAAGAIEAAATVLSLEGGTLPATLGFRGRDSECDLYYCHDGPRPSTARFALSNSFAFGGNVTSLVVGR
jgi:3-oxoacyl-[acyl-carrier-protein] synthase II